MLNRIYLVVWWTKEQLYPALFFNEQNDTNKYYTTCKYIIFIWNINSYSNHAGWKLKYLTHKMKHNTTIVNNVAHSRPQSSLCVTSWWSAIDGIWNLVRWKEFGDCSAAAHHLASFCILLFIFYHNCRQTFNSSQLQFNSFELPGSAWEAVCCNCRNSIPTLSWNWFRIQFKLM